MRLHYATKEEMKYAFPQEAHLDYHSGAIGYLTGNVAEPWYFWNTQVDHRYQQAFRDDLRNIVNEFFDGNGVLSSLRAIDTFTSINRMARIPDSHPEAYAFRCDTAQYTFMIKLVPSEIMGINYTICCYVRQYLDEHISEARAGIPFADVDGNELFRISDGGYICIQPKIGKLRLLECRYVDWQQYIIGGELLKSQNGLYPNCLRQEGDCDVFPLWDTLPKECLYVEPKTGKAIRIKRGVRGYFVTGGSSDDTWINKEEVYRTNKRNNLTNGQVEAMFYGCTHSWADPQANPANYNANGEYVEKE